MRALSSIASFSIHAAAGVAVLFGTTRTARTSPPTLVLPVPWVIPPEENVSTRSEPWGAAGIRIRVDLPAIPPTVGVLQSEASIRPAVPSDWAGMPVGGSSVSPDWSALAGATGPEVLAGPLPAYPELLRQARVEGQVTLEARVDSTGRVLPGSLRVVSASHPGFVEPARQALIATLFRPALVNGRPVSVLVRVPFAFSLRGGTGHAR